MSGVEGWDETVLLNATRTAVISARRGSARLAISDLAGSALLKGVEWAVFSASLRIAKRDGRETLMVLRTEADGDVTVRLDTWRVEPLLELMLAAIYFSEGR
jgi:hypothetical protein